MSVFYWVIIGLVAGWLATLRKIYWPLLTLPISGGFLLIIVLG